MFQKLIQNNAFDLIYQLDADRNIKVDFFFIKLGKDNLMKTTSLGPTIIIPRTTCSGTDRFADSNCVVI